MKTILATTTTFAEESPHLLQMVSEQGLQLVLNPLKRKLTEKELLSLLKGHRPVGMLAGTEPITHLVLKEAKDHLRVISRVGVGWDNVDRDVAVELNILVYRTPGVLVQAVAELTIGLILCALRFIPSSDYQMHQGKWQKHMGRLLQGKIVGIIGFGDIGKRVGELVNAFGAKVIYYDIRPINVSWAEAVSLPDLLAQTDIVTIHANGKKMIFGPDELKACRHGVILVNTARGGLVDEAALYDCLMEGRVAFACLDVFEKEPYKGPLCGLDNVVLTAHIGSYAREARHLMEYKAVENLIEGLHKLGAI